MVKMGNIIFRSQVDRKKFVFNVIFRGGLRGDYKRKNGGGNDFIVYMYFEDFAVIWIYQVSFSLHLTLLLNIALCWKAKAKKMQSERIRKFLMEPKKKSIPFKRCV